MQAVNDRKFSLQAVPVPITIDNHGLINNTVMQPIVVMRKAAM